MGQPTMARPGRLATADPTDNLNVAGETTGQGVSRVMRWEASIQARLSVARPAADTWVAPWGCPRVCTPAPETGQ